MKIFGRTICILLAIPGGLCASLILWGLLSPLVVLHYASDAEAPVLVYFNDNDRIRREIIHPGESVSYPTAMFALPDSFIDISTPFVNRRSLEIKGKFSRVDVCISAQARFSAHTRHRYLARFSPPSETCEVSAHGR